jgi:Right handed beta helix region
MRYTSWCASLMGVALLLILSAGGAHAQATRTWVSGVGDDANPCSRTAPCKTFAGAISKTAAGGEINCLDPGGFGALTITKSIAVKCVGVEGGVLVSGTNGIVVSAASTDVVYLSGLDFEGLTTSLSGVQINTAAKVSIVNCVIRGFNTAGVNVAPSTAGVAIDIVDTIIADNPGTGVFVKPTGSASVRGFLNRVRIANSGGDGLFVNANVTSGSVKIAVRDSESGNNVGNGVGAFSNSSAAQVQIDSSTASNNGTGLAATGAGAVIRFTRTTLTTNATAASQSSGGSVLSYQTNSVDGNGNDGTFGTTAQK